MKYSLTYTNPKKYKLIAIETFPRRIVFDNSANPEILTDYIADLLFTESNIDFDEIQPDGSDIYFTDSGVVLDHYVNGVDLINKTINIFLKLTIPANTSKNIQIYYGGASVHTNAFADVLIRKSAVVNTKYLYKFNDLHDSMGAGADITLTNATLITNDFGTILDCNGTSAYATIDVELPTFGWMNFNFVLTEDHQAGDGLRYIFCKFYSGTKYIIVQLLNDGTLQINYCGYINTLTQTYWKSGIIHSFSLRFTSWYVIGRIDGLNMFYGLKTDLTGGTPMTFGAYNNSADPPVRAFGAVQIFDFEIGEGNIPLGQELARNKGIGIFKDSEINKWEFVSEVSDTFPIGEGSLLSVGNELWLYSGRYTPGVLDSWQERRISTDEGLTWSVPVMITGIPNSTSRSFVFYESGKYYMAYRNGQIAESADGIAFTNIKTYITDSYGSCENVSIIKEGSVYKGILEVGALTWIEFPISGNSLISMSYVLTSPLATIRNSNELMDGLSGPLMMKIGNKYHVWGHTILPSIIWRWTSDNPLTDTWIRKYNSEIFTLDNIHSVDQKADISICEHNGAVYACCSNNNNDFGDITPEYEVTQSIYKYNGTIEGLVGDLEITLPII